MTRKTCVYSGHVQGVGFRYTVQGIAARYPVSGYVRNLPDGRVELVMEGPEGEMEQILQEIQQKMGTFIRHIAHTTAPATGQYQGFEIAY